MLDVALKEWAVICDLLLAGKMTFLLRKGGILETGGPGVFELEHQRFAFFPSWAHQQPQMIKPVYRDQVQVFDEPTHVTMKVAGEVAGIWQVADRQPFLPGGTLDELHPWSAEQIDMRFDYKPQRPLFVLAVRVLSLAEPKQIANDETYGGCRSWVPLRRGDEVDDATAAPVMDDPAFAELIERITAALGRHPQTTRDST